MPAIACSALQYGAGRATDVRRWCTCLSVPNAVAGLYYSATLQARLQIEMTKPVDQVLAAARQRAADHGLDYFGAVTPQEAYTLLTEIPNALLIDVRTRPEWEYVGRVPDSTLIEWNTYPSGARNPRFLDELRSVAANPDVPLLFICRSGQRSDST